MSALGVTLRAAVPMWVARYRFMPPERVAAIAVEAAEELASTGDLVQFVTRRGKMAGAFNLVAKTIACQAILDPELDWVALVEELEKAEAEAFAEGNTTG